MTDDLKQRHMNYLRRKTADESELWAAERIEQLEAERDKLFEVLERADEILVTEYNHVSPRIKAALAKGERND